ncbi:MAG: FAD-dependent oxidoreductase [Pseudomonadota bacterium]
MLVAPDDISGWTEAGDSPHFDVVIVGAGPAGIRAAHRLSQVAKRVLVLDAEAEEPYNRVRLTPLLAGDAEIGDIRLDRHFRGEGVVTVETGARVTAIDPQARAIRTLDGRRFQYDTLVLATGSRPFVPRIPGIERDGVYVFRSAHDVSALIARSFRARDIVVIGGGLLGLEAARGMARRGASVTIVEHEVRLMPRQLDEEGSALLRAEIEALGMTVVTGRRVAEIEGGARVNALWLADGTRLACDTIIVCTGIRANTALAEKAGVAVGRGIVVDAQMQTSVPGIMAVGECAEHKGHVVGLAGPAIEQAEVAARTIAGEEVVYRPTAPVTKLKLIGTDVLSLGDVGSLEQDPIVRSLVWRGEGRYRRLFVHRGRLVGAVAVGPLDWASDLQEGVGRQARVSPFHLSRFRRDGRLWRKRDDSPEAMPEAAIACNCTGVTCGQVRACASAEAVRLETGASTVCGSCAGLVEELIGAGGPPKPVALWRPLLWVSGGAAAAAIATLVLPRIPTVDSYGAFFTEKLWFDGVWKQWSGYILLGITLAAMLLGLRKRIRVTRVLGAYDYWRMVHLALGLAAAGALFAHTGFRFGVNLNAALMTVFVFMMLAGAIAGLATGGEHKLRARGVGTAKAPPRGLPTWVHVIALWPLPILIAAHVLSVYAY